MLFDTRSGLVPILLGMVNWLSHEILISPSFPSWVVQCWHFLSLNSTMTSKYKFDSFRSITPWHDPVETLCTPSTDYCRISLRIYRLQNVHDHVLLQSRLILASTSLTHYLDHGLAVHLQLCTTMASKCIFVFLWSWPPSGSLNLFNHGLGVHLQTRSTMAL